VQSFAGTAVQMYKNFISAKTFCEDYFSVSFFNVEGSGLKYKDYTCFCFTGRTGD